MKAKEIAFDFLETVFFLFCVLFFIFYLFFGGHLGLAKKIFQTFGALSILGVFFVIRWKLMSEEIKKKQKDYMAGDIVAYLEKKDIIKDRCFIVVVSSLVIFIAYLANSINSLDFFQAITTLSVMGVSHLVLFSKREANVAFVSLTEMDEVKDRVILMLLSMILLIETLLEGGATVVDFVQIAFVFASFHYWHKHLFKS